MNAPIRFDQATARQLPNQLPKLIRSAVRTTGWMMVMATLISGFFNMIASTSSAQQPEMITEVEGITEYRYENGVKLLLFPDDSKPQFTVNMTVLVGSRHEGYGESGMAHLLEHMLFKGTDTFPDTPKWLKDRGVLNMNGTTWYDRTNYYETLPAIGDNLEFAIHMEADRLLNSWIRGEDLLSEMTVVRNEFERGENSPERILFQRIMSRAFEWHNYGKATIGNRSDIERVPVDSLRQFYKKYYQPDNVTVVVAGKFDRDEAVGLVTKHFGSIKKPTRELSKTYTEEPAQDGERSVTLRRVGDVPLVGAGYHFPAASNQNFAAAQVLSTILGIEPAGPLYKQLVEPGLASSVSTFTIKAHDPGMLIAQCELPADGNVDEVELQFLNIIETIGDQGITDEDVKRAVRRIMKQREKTFADSAKFAIALSEWQAYGDWRLYFLHRDRLEKVTAADVTEVANKYLVRANRTSGVFLPTKNPEKAPLPAQPQLAKALDGYTGREAIAAGEAFDPTPANIDTRTETGQLDGGAKYALLTKKTRGERFTLRANLHYGDDKNLQGLVTAAEILPELMLRGTNELSFQQFKDRLDELDATMNLSGGAGSISVSVQGKRESFGDVLDLLRQALREPLLPADELEILQQEKVTKYRGQLSEPSALASNELYRYLFPFESDNVRYFPTFQENIDRYESISVDDVKRLHVEYLNGQNVEVAIAGDFDAGIAKQKLTEMFSDWTSAKHCENIELVGNTAEKGGLHEIATPGKANSMYVAGLVVPMKDDAPNYEALLIGNYILGGGPLSSRLADSVRKKKGLSYTVGSQFQANHEDRRGTFMVYAISNPENNDEVINTIDQQIQNLLAEGPTDEELTNARDSYLQKREGSRAEDSQLTSLLLKNLRVDRTMEFYANSDQKIRQLTSETVKAALADVVDTDKLIGVAAGDFSKSVDAIPKTTTSVKP